MQLFRKIGDELIVVYAPTESVEVGDILKAEEGNRGVLAQVIESSLLDLPGILEEVVRSEIIEESVKTVGSTDYGMYSAQIRNMRFARCKIAKEIVEGSIVDWSGYSPSRDASIERIDAEGVVKKLFGDVTFDYPIVLGMTRSGKELSVSSYDLQGLTLIVGRKGMGKSHVGKSLLLGLVSNGANCVVFDINDEYTRLGLKVDGSPHDEFGGVIMVRRPGGDLKFTLPYMGEEVFTRLLESIGVADASLYAVRESWERLAQEERLGWQSLSDAIGGINDSRIKGALERRFAFLEKSQLITDNEEESTTLEALFDTKGGKKGERKKGRVLVVSLRGLSREIIRATVHTLLSRLQILRDVKSIPEVFVFAEEAHLYLNSGEWIEAVTRIRHLGLYQVYLTNTPANIPDLIVRQTDNLLLFHLDLDEDARHVAPASQMNEESVSLVAKSLPARAFVATGTITSNFPVQLLTSPLPTQAGGETVLKFQKR
jgi:uncharacterized protein